MAKTKKEKPQKVRKEIRKDLSSKANTKKRKVTHVAVDDNSAENKDLLSSGQEVEESAESLKEEDIKSLSQNISTRGRTPSITMQFVKDKIMSEKGSKVTPISTRERRSSKITTTSVELDLKEIPTTGSKLLDWVQEHAGYDVEGDEGSSEEEVLPEKVKKKKVSEPASDEEKKKEEKPVSQPIKGLKMREKTPREQIVVKLNRPADMEDDIMKLIKKKKQEEQALILSKSPLIAKTEEMPSTEKKKKKKRSPKRKSKKEKMSAEQMKLEASPKMLEKSRQQEEAERAELIAADQRSEAEQVIRLQSLRTTLDNIKFNNDYNKKILRKEAKDTYWKLYVECGDLPIVNHIADMTMYLESWKHVLTDTTPEEASGRVRDILKLLNVLNDFIDNKPPKTERRMETFKWLRDTFREQLEEMMEKMTYKILRDITKNMHPIDLAIGDFNYKDDRFILCLWLKFQLPKPLFNPRKPLPPPISLNLDSLNMNLDFPTSINGQDMVIRVLYLTYDHLSDKSKSFVKPVMPEYYNYNLVDVIEKEWKVKKKYKVLGRYRALYELEIQKHESNQQEKVNFKMSSLIAPPPDLPPLPKFKLPEVDSKGDIPDVAPMKLDPTAEEYAEALEEVAFTAMKANLLYTPEEYEINLRKYIILGGVYNINLFYQPPQPQHLVTMVLNLTSFVLPKKIAEVRFHESYTAPPPSTEQKTPEELESVIKLQEEAFEKLILVTLSLPKHVMYLEPPVVCMWEEENKLWSTKDIHDVKQNEEKGTVSFRTGRFGIFGLAAFRYGNLPYQTWEIKPDTDGSVLFQLTAAILLFEFKISGSSITVTQFQNGPNNALQDIVTKTFSITKLSRIFKEGGVDIFPDFDAFCYVEGSCEKHWPMEYICYYDMAHLSTCFNFAWSRWNVTEGYRSLVMQARIFNPELSTQRPHSLVLVTPLKASFINCTEVTPVFCSDAVEGSKFCSTLWYLSKSISTIYVRNKLQEISQETIHTVAQMLIGTRILSFC